MIILEKDGLRMGVCTDVQASVFERNGYKRVNGSKAVENAAEAPKEETAVETVVVNVDEEPVAPAESKKRGRKPKE